MAVEVRSVAQGLSFAPGRQSQTVESDVVDNVAVGDGETVRVGGCDVAVSWCPPEQAHASAAVAATRATRLTRAAPGPDPEAATAQPTPRPRGATPPASSHAPPWRRRVRRTSAC